MADRMNLVQAAANQGAIPAARPIDHARRLSAGLAMGIALGTIGAVLLFDLDPRHMRLWIGGTLMLVLLVLTLIPWMIQPRRGAAPRPVVARTLGTKESTHSRFVQRGQGRTGLLVPVVARPLDSTSSFRSIILVRNVDRKNPVDPPVGTLFALEQVEEGLGELEASAQPSAEQLHLIERLRKHPRELANDAPLLPMRRGTLEFTPWWAGLEVWVALAVGVVASALGVLYIAAPL